MSRLVFLNRILYNICIFRGTDIAELNEEVNELKSEIKDLIEELANTSNPDHALEIRKQITANKNIIVEKEKQKTAKLAAGK